MPKIDLARRTQIGQERRAKTRAQLVAAALRLYAERAIEAITVDEVVKEAGVAKGTFYVHFEHLDALTAAVADELVKSHVMLLGDRRRSIKDPIVRIGFGCDLYIRRALEEPLWGRVVARMAWSYPEVGSPARNNLMGDLTEARRSGRISEVPLQVAFEVVVGALLHVMRAAGEKKISDRERPAAVMAMLRAIGVDSKRARAIVTRLPSAFGEEAGAVASSRR